MKQAEWFWAVGAIVVGGVIVAGLSGVYSSAKPTAAPPPIPPAPGPVPSVPPVSIGFLVVSAQYRGFTLRTFVNAGGEFNFAAVSPDGKVKADGFGFSTHVEAASEGMRVIDLVIAENQVPVAGGLSFPPTTRS